MADSKRTPRTGDVVIAMMLREISSLPKTTAANGKASYQIQWANKSQESESRMKVFALGLTVVLVSTCYAQTKPPASTSKDALIELQRSMPSEREFSELLAKANEKVSAFEAAVKNAKPRLDKIDAKYATNYLDAAATAHELISQTLKNGSSAYKLVGVLTTLDDLSLDAASGSVLLLPADVAKGRLPDAAAGSAVFALSTAGTSCNDIAD